jgi:hypothetical protein
VTLESPSAPFAHLGAATPNGYQWIPQNHLEAHESIGFRGGTPVSALVDPMSAVARISDVSCSSNEVGYGPKTEVASASFNQLVGMGK